MGEPFGIDHAPQHVVGVEDADLAIDHQERRIAHLIGRRGFVGDRA
jgi:hypothetical protein